MARSTFGATSVDWLLRPYPFGSTTLVALRTGTTFLTFWDQPTGGTRYTDLLDAFGAPITQVTVVGHQIPLFQGPDAVLAMWADKGDGSPRERIEAQDLAAAASAVAAAEAARDQAVATVVDTVKVTAQTLTDPQKVQARSNVGAVGTGDLTVNAFDAGATIGVGADSTAAINTLLTSLSANGGRAIIPAGLSGNRTVRIDGTVVVPRRVELEIAAGVTCLRGSAYSSSTDPLFRIGGNNAKLFGGGRIETQNSSPNGVVLFGPPDLSTSATVLSSQLAGLTVAGVKASGNIGVRMWSSFVLTATATYQNVVRDVGIDGFGTGVYVADVANANEFHGVQFRNILEYAYDFNGNTAVRGADECAVIGGFVHASPDVCIIRMRNTTYNVVAGLRAEPGGASAKPYDLDATTVNSVIMLQSNIAAAGVDLGSNNLFIVNGRAYYPQGTAAAPGMTFSGDTATGLFRQAAQVLSATTGGVERWRMGTNLSMLTNLQINTNYIEFTQRGTTPGTPGSGIIRMFVRSSDGALCYVNSAGAVKVVTVT